MIPPDDETLEQMLVRVLNENRTVDNKTHEFHHRMYALDLEARKRRLELWEKFKLSIVGSVALGLIVFLGWLGKLVIDNIH